MELASDKQKKFMDDLKINYSSDVTKEQAKQLIQEKVNTDRDETTQSTNSKSDIVLDIMSKIRSKLNEIEELIKSI